MRRIVNGIAYNTDTSAAVAKYEWTSQDQRGNEWDLTGTLYQTHKGVFFVHVHSALEWFDQDDRETKTRTKDEFEPMTPDEATRWLLKGGVEILDPHYAEGIPEAEDNAEGSTVYVRVPASLKRRIDEAAQHEGMSVPAWSLRCFERCLTASGQS